MRERISMGRALSFLYLIIAGVEFDRP
jgi:hypothetical protein